MNKINEFINWVKTNMTMVLITIGLVIFIIIAFRIKLWKPKQIFRGYAMRNRTRYVRRMARRRRRRGY